MTHEEFKKKRIGKWFEESKAVGFQCVAWVKQYSREVFEVVLGSFWGSAVIDGIIQKKHLIIDGRRFYTKND